MNEFRRVVTIKRILAIFSFAALVTASANAPALAANSACELATNAEVSAAAGKSVDNGTVSGPLNSACMWHAASDSTIQVLIQRTPRDYWSPERLAAGYRKIDGIGEKAFSVPELGGWKACALSGKNVVCVDMDGGRASADAATALLRTSLQHAGSVRH